MRTYRYLLLLLVMLMSAGLTEVRAQYNTINFDYKTASAMATEYNAAAATEAYYKSQVQDMLEKYGLAEVASAGIYTSKHLDRKALSNIGLWSNGTENYYYRRIYHLVSVKIIPEMWGLAQMLVRYPHKAIYWGSYLVKTTTEVQNLCKQFESIVTNGSLSFSDINFLEVNPAITSIIQLSKMGDTDWKAMLSDLYSLPDYYSKDDLNDNVETLYSLGTQLAAGGYANMVGSIMGSSSFEGDFKDKAQAAYSVVKNVRTIYDNMDGNMGATLKNYWGDSPTAADIFSFASYNFASWMNSYVKDESSSFYTQRYYIACIDEGQELVCDYNPPKDDNSVIKGPQWTRFDTKDSNFFPSSTQLEQVLSNSESYAGWSRSYITSLNNQNSGYTYSMSKSLWAYSISKGGKQTKKAYAYSIKVYKKWHIEETVYEEVFDSYSMNLNVFMMKLNGLLAEYNDNEEGKTYKILSDSKRYYQVADAKAVQGCEMAIISMTCTDNVALGGGATQYKCKKCSGSLNNHSKECAMKTTGDYDDGDNIAELEELISGYEHQIDSLQRRNSTLQSQIASLSSYLNSSTISEATKERYQNLIKQYGQEYDANLSKIQALQSKLSDAQQALEEARNDQDGSDDYYRIPAIMEEVRNAYALTWEGNGWWSGYTFYRYAKSRGINGQLTFAATLSIARKPQYFLGIRIHRAILKISWELTAKYTETQVMDQMMLDPDMNDAIKAKIVSDRISELARDYPDCQFSTEYIKTEDSEEEEDDEDVQHLLWASDRLAIARQIEARLMNIYADIVSMKKMMHYRLDILDAMKGISPYVNDEQGRRQTLANRCRRRWLRNAADSHHAIGYNGKYEIDDEENQ